MSQATISRAITAVTPLLGRAWRAFVPTAEDLHAGTQYVVDGTLLPCWSWAGHRSCTPAKTSHGMTCRSLHARGTACLISDPVDGARHDVYCLDDPASWTHSSPATGPGTKDTSGRGILTSDQEASPP